MKRKWIAGTLALLLIVAGGAVVYARGGLPFLSGSDQKAKTESKQTISYSETYIIFDTVVNMKLYGEHAKPSQLKDIKHILEGIDNELSRTLETSEIYKVNQAAGQQAVKVSQATFDVVKKALDYAVQTGGLYDPTIGPLVSLWNIGGEGAHVPSKPDLDKTVNLIGYKDVLMDPQELTIKLLRPGMALDLGGIGKGYAADQIAVYLKSQQVDSAIINLGGSSIIALGSKPGGKSWNIGLQDPDQTRGTALGNVLVKNKTVDASGVYERFFMENGVRYHHILDPRTGFPSRSGLKSVTIISDSATDADALSTAVFIMGLDEGMKFIEKQPGIEAFFITEDNRIFETSGLKDQIRFTNPDYTVETLG
ncbi:FAD:protein FMN transferase [Paenibacillus sp.]|jgi:thiamine biosynthesis lipoprotein|uniref:FAD:protein FMN transferase n=1 Tax=Paenibacillus sp. TaxID=58172 RepID=UPI0028179455|nr:FAD:protein FMN transferase [Paenibacillus sp.]MDR0267356.1 FAD:protein FMN transferase [Paenibacillus sp.]